ncbi:putative sporulation protein YtxC [Caminicella sporogenes DSM 14501]|uniref:Putative sporulation protein YtxC n=1 Tax=Caminicella sporogenes DSM 14501 TaxID=1121266 RepID=A0A1M6R4A2_9FIRM|nr:putative sporulation protein YtxC [Caminicella sporogenes DSM 14501]
MKQVDIFLLTIKENEENVQIMAEKIINSCMSQEFSVKSDIIKNGRYNTIYFYIDDCINNDKDKVKDFINFFKHYAAIVIADYIIDVLELEMAKKILKNNYCFLKPVERKIIIEELNKSLENEFYDGNVYVPYKVNRKAKILYELLEFLSIEEIINVNGFVKFRLQNYIEDLSRVLEKVVEKYMKEKEYKEFIKLLRYFVNIQEPKMDVINIVVDKAGRYHFYDKNLKAIRDSSINDLTDDLKDNNLNGDDLLISSLINIAPRKIIIHYISNIKNNEIIETIKNIFDDRLHICNNCRICNLNKEIKEE